MSGRPKKAESEKLLPISIALKPALVAELDEARGTQSRGGYISAMLEARFKRQKKAREEKLSE